MRDIFTTLERKKKRVPRNLLMALSESVQTPKGVLVEWRIPNYRKAQGRKLPIAGAEIVMRCRTCSWWDDDPWPPDKTMCEKWVKEIDPNYICDDYSPPSRYAKLDPGWLGEFIHEDVFSKHYHFDSAPHTNIRMVDVARALDNESRKANPSPEALSRLVDRVITSLSHTVIAIQGRPEGARILGMLHRAFNRILERLPMFESSLRQSLQQKVRDNRWIIAEGLDGTHELRD